ncbi:hypothetical protein [Streptomyces sp. NBC_00872]|nr:hypothetical protein OG214_14685 [Streptomyces sp. NBC_00872]
MSERTGLIRLTRNGNGNGECGQIEYQRIAVAESVPFLEYVKE